MPKFKFWGYIDVRIDCETVVEAEDEDEAREIAQERFSIRDELEEQLESEDLIDAHISGSEEVLEDKA